MFWIIQDCLYEGLKRRVACLQAVDIFLVDTLPSMIRIRVIDALGPVYGGAGSAAWGIAIALEGRSVSDYALAIAAMFRRTQAVPTTIQHAILVILGKRDCEFRPRPASNYVQLHTLDFLLLHAIHAVLTHRLLLAAEDSFSFLRDLDLPNCVGDAEGLALLLSLSMFGLVVEVEVWSVACGRVSGMVRKRPAAYRGSSEKQCGVGKARVRRT